MFEDSLVESRVGHVSTGRRWTIFGSIGVQGVLAALVIALPLLHPAALPFQVNAPRVMAPLLAKPPVRVPEVKELSSAANPAGPSAMRPVLLPSLLPGDGRVGEPPPIAALPFGSSMNGGVPDALTAAGGSGPRVSVAPARAAGPLHISTGLSDGMLLAPIRPVYPAIARAAGVQGTVVVEAVISRAGTIEDLRVVSGPLMLQAAALEAIRAARYRPYRLNGELTAVQTTITVNFRMGG